MSRLFENRLLKRFLHINDTPEAIALGAAVGMFIGMTPTVGIQMLLMIVVGTVIRANRIAGVAMVYVSNPFTILPIYWLDYLVGSTLLGWNTLTYARFEATCTEFMDQLDAAGLWPATVGFVSAHSEVAAAMCVGGVVLGVIFAIPVYPLTLRLVLAHRRHRARVEAKAERRAERKAEMARANVEPAEIEPRSPAAEPAGSEAAREGAVAEAGLPSDKSHDRDRDHDG